MAAVEVSVPLPFGVTPGTAGLVALVVVVGTAVVVFGEIKGYDEPSAFTQGDGS